MKTFFRKTLILIFWILVWGALAAAVDQKLLLPSPRAVIVRLFALCGTAAFWQSVLFSLVRMLIGIALGIAAGLVLALITSKAELVKQLISPLLTVIKATPVASFIILMLIWIGRDTIPAVIAALLVLPMVWSNVSAGIANVDRDLLEMARVYRMGFFTKLGKIVIPSLRPYFLSAVQAGIGMGWKAGVAAEVLTLPRLSIGKHIYDSKLYLETTDLFAWTLVVVIISLVVEKAAVAAIGKRAKRRNKV